MNKIQNSFLDPVNSIFKFYSPKNANATSKLLLPHCDPHFTTKIEFEWALQKEDESSNIKQHMRLSHDCPRAAKFSEKGRKRRFMTLNSFITEYKNVAPIIEFLKIIFTVLIHN